MNMNDKSIDSRLLRADVAISNAMVHEEVSALLGEYLYTEKKLQAGNAIRLNAHNKQQAKNSEYAEKEDATKILDELKMKAHKYMMKQVKVARVALDGNLGLYKKLMLNGTRKATYTGWLKQSEIFYSQALSNADALKLLAEYGITRPKLEAGQKMVDDVNRAYKKQHSEDAEAQNATKERDAAIEELDEWMSKFIAVARVALDEHPQYLEMLGVIEPS